MRMRFAAIAAAIGICLGDIADRARAHHRPVRSVSVLAIVLLATCGGAWGQTGIPIGVGAGPGSQVLSSAGTVGDVVVVGPLSQGVQDGGSFLGVNLSAYGAKCDGTTDDSAAITSAFAVIRTAIGSASGISFKVTGGGPGNGTNNAAAGLGSVCVVKNAVNMTALRTPGQTINVVTVDMSGILIDCVGNIICLDAVNTRFINFKNVSVQGDCTSIPTIGMQIGKIAAAESDGLHFDNPKFSGCFSTTAFLNVAVESTSFNHPQFWNSQTGGYAYIADGYNHWNLASSFATITTPTDTAQSFLGVIMIGADLREFAANGNTIWMGNAGLHEFINGYGLSGATGHNVVLYGESGGSGTVKSNFNMHFEGSNASTFFISGTYATPRFSGFRYSDPESFSTAELFQIDGGSSVTGVTFTDAMVSITTFNTGAATLFDVQAKYSFQGSVFLPAAANWNSPNVFYGCLTFSGSATQCNTSPVVGSMIINGDFMLDQPNEGGATTPATTNFPVQDKWRTSIGTASKLTFQRVGVASAQSGFGLEISTASATAVGAAGFFTVLTFIEGPYFAGSGWGAAGASPVALSWCANANNSGQYSLSLHNAGITRSYVTTYTLVANTRACFSTVIPGDTTGVWLKTPATTAIQLNFSAGIGTNDQTSTLNAWQASSIAFGATGDFQLVANVGATLTIDSVHMASLPFPIANYQLRPFGQELQLAQRYYQKSFPLGTAPAQSAGLAGAICTKNAIANGDPSVYVQLNTPLQAAPTITTFNPSAANANWRDVTAAADATVSVDPATAKGPTGFQIVTSGTVTTLGDILCIHYTTDSGF